MAFVWYSLFALIVVAADQITKHLVVQKIPLFQQMPLLPGVVGLTHVHNEGAAFSSFEGMQWLFVLIFAAFSILILYEYFWKNAGFVPFERWCIAAIYGGGAGNMIDRLRQGYVVDMIETEFMTFPVFNVADCFITCGCILLAVHMVFFNRRFWKDG